MRVAVTGSSGYVGHNLVPFLRLCGYDVVEYDPVIGNQALDLLYDRPRPDAIVHLAAQSNVATAWHVQSLIRTNIDDLAALVDGLQGWPGRFVFTSSSAVYALPESGLYGYSKAFGETMVRERLPVQSFVIRPFNIVGGHDSLKNDHVVPKLALAVRTKTPFHVYGGGEERRSYVHVETVCQLVHHILRSGPTVREWDALGDETLTVNEVVALCQETLGPVTIDSVGARRDNPSEIRSPGTCFSMACFTRAALRRAFLEQMEGT